MNLRTLSRAVRDAAALRRIQRLQPAAGRGSTIFPPTYPAPRSAPRESPPCHVYSRQHQSGVNQDTNQANGASAEVWTVLLDSVQSQANRLEEVLLGAADEGLPLPFVTVDFSGADLAPLSRITSLDAPHRVYDAVLRDSHINGTDFMSHADGRKLAAATPADATALLELSPNALLFGSWHSQGQGGGLGAKFPRAIVSEIIGIDVPVDKVEPYDRDRTPRHLTRDRTPRYLTTGRRTGSRMDPIGIRREVDVFKAPDGSWDTTKESAGQGAKKKRPSEINHGNIAPTVEPLGVTCAYAEHRTYITFAGLRRLRFGGPARDSSARTMLAALGILALVEQDIRGYALRSRCDLVCEGRSDVEIVRSDGSTESVALDRDIATTVYRDAYAAAEEAGFSFRSLTLKPQDKLVDIIRQSRELALTGRGEEEA